MNDAVVLLVVAAVVSAGALGLAGLVLTLSWLARGAVALAQRLFPLADEQQQLHRPARRPRRP
jgi:hypothetical protein